MADALIKPTDVIKHYKKLLETGNEKVRLKVFEGFSHIDFTYASHHVLLHELIKTINSTFDQ